MTPMLLLDRLRYEARILGPLLFLIPLAEVLGFAGLTVLFLIGNIAHNGIAALLIAVLEACLPLTVGLLLATVAVQDAALEVLLTMRASYRRIVFLRFALILSWMLLVEGLAALALAAFLPWVLVKPLLAFQLTWLAPSLWLAGVSILLALVLHSRTSSGAMLGCLWLFQLLFHGYLETQGWTQPWFLFATLYTPDASFWLTNRLELIVTGCVVLAAAWWFLRNPERRFFGEDA